MKTKPGAEGARKRARRPPRPSRGSFLFVFVTLSTAFLSQCPPSPISWCQPCPLYQPALGSAVPLCGSALPRALAPAGGSLGVGVPWVGVSSCTVTLCRGPSVSRVLDPVCPNPPARATWAEYPTLHPLPRRCSLVPPSAWKALPAPRGPRASVERPASFLASRWSLLVPSRSRSRLPTTHSPKAI